MEKEDKNQLGRNGNDLEKNHGTDCQSGDWEVFMKEKKKGTKGANDECSQDERLSSHFANDPQG